MGKSATIIFSFIKKNSFAIVFTVLFICFILFAASYSILSADDFYSVFITSQETLTQAITEVYYSWSFRLSAIVVNYALSTTLNNLYSLFVFQITTFILIYLATFFVIKKITLINTNYKLLFYSLVSTCVLYFSSHNLNEAVFWMAAATNYLYAIPLFFAGLFLAIDSKPTLLKTTTIVILFFVAGGFSEVYGLTFLILLLIILLRKIILKQNYTLLIIAIVACFSSFFINFSAPGNSARASFLPASNIATTLLIGTKTIIKTFTIHLRYHQLIALFLAIYILLKIRLNNGSIVKYQNFIFLSFLSLAILPIYICSYVLSDAPPDRILILSEFSFIIVIALYVSKYNLKPNYLLATACITLAIYFVANYKNTINYYAVNTQQLATLKKLNNKNHHQTYSWKNTNSSGLIYPTNINSDSNYYTNQHVKKFLFLNFNIVSKN